MIYTAVDGSLKFDTKVDTKGFQAGTNTIRSQANSLKSSFAGIAKMAVAAFGVAQLLKFGKQAIDTASDLQEVQNVVDTAFGGMAYKMEEFAKTSIESFGISKLAAKQTGSVFMAMGAGMGLAGDNASDMAIALTGLSADMSSFYNVTQDTASTALKSIFTGETETLKQFGIVMTEANLQAYAMSQGITKNIKDMTQAEKVQLRYGFVMNQTTLAQGDFAKTSGSWANQTRVLGEKFKELLGILGTGLIQVLTPVVKLLSTGLTYLTQFATQVGSVLSSVFKLGGATASTAQNTASIAAGASDASTGLTDMGDAAEEANKKANGLSGIDKLNNMTEDIAKNSSTAADSMSMMGGGGNYGVTVTPTVNPADTTALEAGLSTTMLNIQNGFTMFNTWLTENFAPIFASIWTGLQPVIETFKTIVTGVFTDLGTLVQPLLDYFSGSFTPFLQQYISTAGTIVTGLLDTFNTVFSDIWNIAVFPILQNFLAIGLPTLTDFWTQYSGLMQTIFEEVKAIFDMLWNDVAAPALAFFTKVWTDVATIMSDFWKKWGKPIFDKLKEAWKTTSELFQKLWTTTLKPVWDTFMKVVDKIWTDHLKPLVANFMDFVGTLVDGALEIYNKFIAPIIKWIVEKFGPPIAKVVSWLVEVFGDFFGGVIDAVSNTITVFKDIINFIVDVFTGDWEGAWDGIKKIFSDIWDALVDVVKIPINLIIGLINGLVGGIVDGLNMVIKAMNKLSFSIPDWVPGIGGKSFGINIPELSYKKIPKLATGTVIPPNSEFLALLGDQKKGVNIEAPLQTIVDAFKKVQGQGGGKSEIHIHLEGDAKGVFKLVRVEENKNYDETGIPVFMHD